MTAFDAANPGATGTKACEAIAETMIGHFATRLEVEARKAGGSLTAEAIRDLADRFLADEARRFTPTFRRSYDSCTVAREQSQWQSARRRPFDRILMKRFAHLFPARQGDDGGKGILSRRLIPGFNLAVDKMIGPALYEQCQRKSQAILERHRMSSGAYDWDAIHTDPDTQALTNDVLVVVAHYFSHFERRREWFLDLVNSHLAPAQHGAPDEHWQLTAHGFAELMHALFADLRTARLTGVLQLNKRYGEHAMETLGEFFRRLDRV